MYTLLGEILQRNLRCSIIAISSVIDDVILFFLFVNFVYVLKYVRWIDDR